MPKLKKLRETVETHIEKEENLLFPESSERLCNRQREGIANKLKKKKCLNGLEACRIKNWYPYLKI